MAYSPNNPVGSTSPKDLIANAENFDLLSLGDAPSYPDRKGISRKSWKGMEEGFDADQQRRESDFGASQTDRSDRFDAFIESSGYEVVGDYASQPVTLTERNQLMLKDGELWKPKPSTALPFSTTGAWASDSTMLVSVGDAALRQEMASLTGYRNVGLPSPAGTLITLETELNALDKEYPRAAWAFLAGNLQIGPLIVNAARHIRFTGDVADKAYNNLAYQNILSGLPPGAEVEHPARGLAYLEGDLNITATGTSLRGKNSGNTYDRFIMQFMNPAVPAFNVKRVGLGTEGMLFHAAIVGRAASATQDCLNFDVAADGGHADARIFRTGFVYFRAGASVTKSAARNINFVDCPFSNLRHAFAMEYAVTGPEDQRVFEFTVCKYHSIGRLQNATDSVFYFNPLSQALGLVVDGGHADDSVRIMRGFAGQSSINGLQSTRAAGAYADLDATGYSLPGYERFIISNGSLMNINTTSHQFSGIKAVGSMHLKVDGFVLDNAGGHGIEIHSSNTKLRGVSVSNASMGLTNTYSGFFIATEAANTALGGSCDYSHGRMPNASTTAKFAVENLGTDTRFQDTLLVDNLVGDRAYYIDPAKTSRGQDPVASGSMQRVSQGAGSPPTTGSYRLGDKWENISSSGYVRVWSCINPNPLTWVPLAP